MVMGPHSALRGVHRALGWMMSIVVSITMVMGPHGASEWMVSMVMCIEVWMVLMDHIVH